METNFDDDGYYNTKLQQGLQYQDFLIERLPQIGIILQPFSSKVYQFGKGESHSKIEVKFDDKFKRTRNLWVEAYEKSNPQNPNYVASGVLRDNNTFLWAQGDYETLFIFCKKELVNHLVKNGYTLIESSRKTSHGYLLPEPAADKICSIKIRFYDDNILKFQVNRGDIEKIVLKKQDKPRDEEPLSKWGLG